MNILFLTLSAIGDIEERGIYTDLIREFKRRGHNVFVVVPSERRSSLPSGLFVKDGVNILRVKTLNIQKTNAIEKGIAILMLEGQYKRAIKKYWADVKFDLVLYSTPPITFNKVIEWQKKNGAHSYLMLKDIFPQNAVDLGMMQKGSFLYKMFRKKEHRLYEISDFIGCMSPANCQYVQDNNPEVSAHKLEVCPNAVEITTSVNPDKSVRLSYSIPIDKPLFIYGGNLGKPQGIDFLIQLLDACKDRSDLHICVVGSGTEYPKLKKWYEETTPGAVTLLSALPKPDYDSLVSTADVGMIFLDHRFSIPNFPSRLLSYLENKLPVLLATDKNTDMGKIAEENRFGLWSESNNLDDTIHNINKLSAAKPLREEMGQNAYQFLIDNYTVDKVADTILNHFI